MRGEKRIETEAQRGESMKRILLALIRLYQSCISAYRPSCCRFYPTCSQYAKQAIEQYGAGRGGWLALRRLLRCHPFSKENPYDPVPEDWKKR